MPSLKTQDLRYMLSEAGIGQYQAAMAIQYMNFLPRTCDPYAQGVMLIVQGLQTLLNKAGADLEVDGNFDEATEEALKPFAGPLWYDKSWAQLYGDVLNGGRDVGSGRKGRHAMAGYEHADLGHTAYQHVGELGVAEGGTLKLAAMALCALYGYSRTSGDDQKKAIAAGAYAAAAYFLPVVTTGFVAYQEFGKKGKA